MKINFQSKKLLFFIFLFLSLLSQYRANTFFFFDEWDEINLFAGEGFRAILIPHNEHFKPLFFAFYYLENRIFGDNYSYYIFVNLILHSLAGVLLFCFLNRLANYDRQAEKFSFLISVFFIINYLHSENLQWAFEQCLLLQNLIHLLAFNVAWDFVVKGNVIRLFAVTFCCLIAPLFFGNGLILPLQVGVVIFLSAIFINNSSLDKKDLKLKIKAASQLFLFCLLGLAIAIILYSSHRNPEKTYDLLHYPIHSLKYLYVTSFLGTFLRGTGLFPALSYQQLEYFLGEITDKKLVNFSHWGLLTDILLLFLLLKNYRNKMEGLRYWLMGNALIFTSMLLPALGRSIYHLHQGLYLRYYSLSLLGLAVICFFILKNYAEFSFSKKISTKLIIVCFVLIQISQARKYTYFTDAGQINYSVAQKIKDNKAKLTDKNSESPNDYQLRSLQLVSTEDISQMDANYVYQALNWLNPSKYP